jgi:type 1 glutamine amidotransferase
MNACLMALMLATAGTQEAKPKKIVLIAGPLDSHPRETHEYERNVLLLKHCLMTAPALKGARVEVHFNGWPADPSTLDDADTIFFSSGGSEPSNVERNPIYVGDRLAVLERQMNRGCGLVQFHWSTFNPVKHHDRITEWVGGYFDAESGPGGKWASTLATREWKTSIGTPDHPIARGVEPFPVKEEFYFKLRFREDDPRLKPILLCAEGDVRANTVAYAVERKDGGRGFGFTGGHFYANWWVPGFRKLVLNAIAWTAKVEVPPGGVESVLDDPIRVLILTGHHYPAHEWKVTTPPLIAVLEQDPRVRVGVTEDVADLATAKLEEAQVLVLNYMNWGRPGLSEEQKRGLLRFLERGGGFAAFHGATGVWSSTLCPKESDWPEFKEKILLRPWASKSGHDNFGPFRVEIAAPDHEITRGLAPFDTKDELYVDLGGDAPATALVTAASKVAARNEPLAWAHSYGKGRLFVTALGHGAVSIRSAGALFRRGIVWAANRPPLAFDPPAEQTEKAIVRPGTWAPAKPKD